MSDTDAETYDLADPGDDRPGLEDLDLVEDGDDDLDGDGYDDLEDATDDEIDFVVALYREDGQPQAESLVSNLANDFDLLIDQLRRYPGDSGVLGMVSIDGDFFVLLRVRGEDVQVMLSDDAAAADFPIARDAVDFLGEDIDEDDEESGPVGDMGMLADVGCSEFELERLAGSYDDDADEICQTIAERIGMGVAFAEVLD